MTKPEKKLNKTLDYINELNMSFKALRNKSHEKATGGLMQAACAQHRISVWYLHLLSSRPAFVINQKNTFYKK